MEKSGKWGVLKNIMDKSENFTNARDNQGNMMETVYACLFNQLKS